MAGQPASEDSYVLGPGTAAPADELRPTVSPGDRLLEVLIGCQAAEDPVRRLPVAGLGVGSDRPSEVATDDLGRVQDHLGFCMHHGDRGQRRVNQDAQQVLETVTVSQLRRGAEAAVRTAGRG